MNQLLANLPAEELRRIHSIGDTFALEPRQVLSEPGQPQRHLYFPTSGVVALLSLLTAPVPRAIAITPIGPEGVVGSPFLADDLPSAHRAVVQIPGEAICLPVEYLKDMPGELPHLCRNLTRAAWSVAAAAGQVVACNAIHQVQHRIIYWLLQLHDRVDGDTFSITHEHLSSILGIRRPSVTAAARQLQSAGYIAYRRGRVTIVDRAGLEAAGCECYGSLRRRLYRPFDLGAFAAS